MAKEDVPPEQKPPAPVKQQGLSGKVVALVLGVIAILAAAAAAVIILTREPPAPPVPVDTVPQSQVVTMENVDDITADVHEKVEMGMFETHMNTEWNFADSKSPSYDAVMGNSSANHFPFYFTLTVENEVIFTSGLMPVGSQIKEILLEKELPAGSYAGVVTIYMQDDEGNPIDTDMGINVTVNINA